MSIQKFHDNADRLADLVERFITRTLKKSGDSAHTCQQTHALEQSAGLSATLNGTEEEHLSEPQSEFDSVFIELDRAMAESVIEAVNVATISRRLSDEVAESAQAATTLITDALV
ncbi:hypothetical protein [Marinobacter salarius]|uniref:Uncharacterized protein n=1 Tax=Marinobacter salarius TaxID=1420917 RepID=A0A1W6KFI7_9GAMM|nr:hypothetical protein [Marinobacter salarius]ARM86170.1 hypothetical protein MARSALSMR5_04150 [Marinobacter salarius]